MTAEDAMVLDRMRRDFPFFAAATLKLVNKAGDLVPFMLNNAQRKILTAIRKQEKAKQPVRLIIVKGRQLGCSAFISAYYFWKVMTKRNVSALIVADEHKDSQGLLQKSHIFYDNFPNFIRPTKKYRSKKELYLQDLNSSLEVDTASNTSLGRSRTFQLVHLSEKAFYPGEAEKAMLSLKQTVPLLSNTYIIEESTSNGIDNIFYDDVQRALSKSSEYEVVFLPWTLDDSYALGEEEPFELDPEEQKIKREHKLLWRQLRWRRYIIENQCQGLVELFKQEYPLTVEESFLYSGHPVFNPVKLKEAYNNRKQTVFRGYIDILKETLIEHPNGELKIYGYPNANRVYTIGLDPAFGIEVETLDRDYTAIVGWDAISKEQVFSFKSRIQWDEVAHIAVILGKYYNNAYIIPERNNHGLAVISKMRDLKYGFIYRERDYDETGLERKDELGFLTTQRKKPLLISHFVDLFKADSVTIHDEELINEMSTYTQDKRGRLCASHGKHDDLVMSAALGLWGVKYTPIQMLIENSKPFSFKSGISIKDLSDFGKRPEAQWLKETFSKVIN